jgi:hypothetical protein
MTSLSHWLTQDAAIVGNGPSEVGKGSGRLIDSHKTILRFNNFILNPEHYDDYGSRTDCWVTSFYLDILPRKERFKQILCPLPIHSTKFRYDINWRMYESCKEFVTVIPEACFTDLYRLIATPSTGIAMLYWIYREYGLSEKKVFGFSFFDKRDRSRHYFDNSGISNHNGRLERKIFEMMTRDASYQRMARYMWLGASACLRRLCGREDMRHLRITFDPKKYE